MSSRVEPLHRLVNLRRRLTDMLMGRRLSADSEKSGVVDLADFGRKASGLAEFAAESLAGLAHAPLARPAVEDVELAARLAALMETLPRTPQRVGRQCDVLEEAQRHVEAAIRAEGELREAPSMVSLAVLAGHERDLFAPFLSFVGRIEESRAGRVDRWQIRRALRRALLEHAEGPFELSVDREGTLRFPGHEFRTGEGGGLPRSGTEPPEVKRALDLCEATKDPAFRDFLMAKAADKAAYAFLSARLGSNDLIDRARALPRRPGKRMVVRPEAVTFPIPGWQATEAATAAEKLAARRIGPEWARLPKGAYVLRLFFGIADDLAADLLALGPALRRMEKGESVEGSGDRAARALRGLLDLLG